MKLQSPGRALWAIAFVVLSCLSWPVYEYTSSVPLWLLNAGVFTLLLFAVDRTASSSWPYHFAWAGVGTVLAIGLPIVMSLSFSRSLIDTLVNTALVATPIVGVLIYRVLKD